MYKQPEGLPVGLYFGLSRDKYHSDPALGHSGMVHILKSLRDYWEKSPLNPSRTFKVTPAMVFGDRCHELLLEPESFFKRYTITGSGYKPGTQLINSGEWERIRDSIEEIKAVPSAHAYFKNGYSEVSIIWIDPYSGIRLKARIDYMRTFGGIDYKRIKTILQEEMGWAIADHGYDIQEWLYRLAIRTAKEQVISGQMKVYGDHSEEWMKKFLDSNKSEFRFFFQRSEPPFVFDIYSMDSEIIDNARVAGEIAISRYKQAIEKYGADKWPAGSGSKTKTFTIYHMPRRILDRGGIDE